MAQPSTNLDLIIGGKKVRLGQKDYVAAGGEATIYRHGGTAVRIYHDPKAMPPEARLRELIQITRKNVVKPIELVLDAKSGLAIGFTMAFVTDTEPLVRFFAQAFRKGNNISPVVVGKLVLDIQDTVRELINAGFLPVDLNPMNIIPSMKDFCPWFIDIASWKTPSFPATAIMDSVRDPVVKGDAFTEGSTWYSYGVIATQLYLGIHPFHGMHPVHKMDWKKRMELNESIFDPKVKLPPVVPPFSIVPKEHLEWLKRLFGSSTFRDAPPVPGAVQPMHVTPQAARVVNVSGAISVTNWLKAPAPVVEVYCAFGHTYVVTIDRVYWVSGQYWTPICDRSNHRNALVLQLSAEDNIIALVNPGTVEFHHYSRVGGGSTLLEKVPVTGNIFMRNGRFYTGQGMSLVEHEFMKLGSRLKRLETAIGNLNELTSKLFDGVIYQDLFGKAWLTVPFAAGAATDLHVGALDGWRVLDAKCMGQFCVVIGEKSGVFRQFILMFNPTFSSFTVREVPDQQELNFTVTNGGICVILVGDKLELFRQPNQAKVVDNSPIDASTKLLCVTDSVCFADGDEVQKLSVK